MLEKHLKIRKDLEVIIDVAVNAGDLISTGKIVVEDSRNLIDGVIEIAEAFEEKFKNFDWNDQPADESFKSYISEVDEFSTIELIKKYGSEKELLKLEICSASIITLVTYDDNNDPSGKKFTVPTNWAREKIAKLFNRSLEQFLVEYTWDDTLGWPLESEREGMLILNPTTLSDCQKI